MTALSPRITITSGKDVPLEAILAFARRMYGAHGHQAKEAYYHWSYLENPHCTDGLGHAVVALTESGEVVGMVNRFLMRWQVQDQMVVIPGIGDLVVDEAHRKGGLGLRMVMQSTRGPEHAFVNGSNPNSSPLFRGLKYHELKGAFWGSMINDRIRAAWRHGLYRVMGRTPHRLTLPAAEQHGDHVSMVDPNETMLARLAELLNGGSAKVKLHWTVESVRWRFFHELGPRHVLIHEVGDVALRKGALLLSVGVRHGLRISRPIAYRATSGAPDRLFKAACAFTKAHGIDVLAGFTFDPKEIKAMEAIGFCKNVDDPPAAFFYHKRSLDREAFKDILVQGAASDMGLEAIDRVQRRSTRHPIPSPSP